MKRTILVVDDEPEKAQALVQHLGQEGYRVQLVDSGVQALGFLEKERPDLVICDLEMPDLGGYQIMEATATYLNMRDLPFLLANEEWTMENWSRRVGGRSADCHVGKPYVVLEIAVFVKRIFKSIDEDVDAQN